MAAADVKPWRVLVTGAAGQIAYSLIPLICDGTIFGQQQPVILHMLDIPQAEAALEGIVMEIEDGAYPLLKGVVATVDVQTAFTGVNVAILVGGFPRLAGMDRADLLGKNAAIFEVQGKALNDFADADVKVLVVANPANTNCLIAASNAPRIPKENFSALTRLDQNRATGAVAKQLGVGAAAVQDVIIWGNHSNTMVPYLGASKFQDAQGNWKSTTEALAAAWIQDFVPFVQTRGAAVIKARGKSSAMSAANAVKDHLQDWLLPAAKPGKICSMAVWTTGQQYGVAKGLYFSLPVIAENGKYKVVSYELDENTQALLKVTEKELLEERETAGVKLE